MIHFYDKPDQVIQHFELMKSDGRKPDPTSYDCLIKAYPNSTQKKKKKKKENRNGMILLTSTHIYQKRARGKSQGCLQRYDYITTTTTGSWWGRDDPQGTSAAGEDTSKGAAILRLAESGSGCVIALHPTGEADGSLH